MSGFVEVARAAGEGAIRQVRGAISRSRDDVLDLEGEIEDRLGGSTVFATMAGPPGHEAIEGVHRASSRTSAAARSAVVRTSASTSSSSSACCSVERA